MTDHDHRRLSSSISRRSLLAGGLAVAAKSLGAQPLQIPTRAVTIIAPFAAGGSVDVVARTLASALSEELGVPVIIDNKPGASGAIAAAAAARAPADGSVLYFGPSSTQSVLPNLRAKLPYDPVSDFSPLSLVAEAENALVVNPKLPIQTVNELVAYCKARPGQVAFGSHGRGSLSHLATEMLRLAAGIEVMHVPYKSSAALDVGLIGDQVHFTFATLASAMPHLKSGRMRALALASRQRSPYLPSLPTMAEAGYTDVVVVSWVGLYAPRGVETVLLTRLAAASRAAVDRAAFRERLQPLLTRAISSSPEELAVYQAHDSARWASVVRSAKIPVEG